MAEPLPQDWRVDVYRAGRFNAVRITHLPSGRVATCDRYESEHQNKIAALADLKRRVAK